MFNLKSLKVLQYKPLSKKTLMKAFKVTKKNALIIMVF